MNPLNNKKGGAILTILIIGFIAFILYGNRDIVAYLISKSAREIINENRELKKVISNITKEDQIGYAKVQSQKIGPNGRMFTKLRFVETDRNNPNRKILEKIYLIEGDVVHFDCLIIKFSNQLVMDGEEKAIYLWRRVYGEKMNPEDGYEIECEGEEPKRYSDIFSKFSIVNKDEFWQKIWSLGNDPDRLRKEGIQAIYGNVIYKKIRPNYIYIFKIDNKGGVYPEIVPDI